MRVIFFIFFAIVLSLFLVSCEQSIPAETQDRSIEGADKPAETIAGTACTAHWECFDDEYKVYQLDNCTRTQTTKCERGCINGTCRPAEVCTVGFKCIGGDRYGYQKEDCSFINKKTCEGGCVDNKCLEKTANASNVTGPVPASPANSYAQENQEENSTGAAATIRTLQLGEEQEIEIDGQMHIVKIYNIEADRAIISVDGERSDWMSSGDTFSYSNIGVTFRMEAIMFQTYGVKAIDYSYS